MDIFNKDFNQCTEPVVCEGTEIGNWHWTTELKFESVCQTISQTAFGPKVSAPNDPLFINLNLYVNENYDTINQIAALITKYFSHKLLPERFSRQGINPDPEKSVNICTTHINELLGKIIIICDSGFQNTDLDELVNISSSTIGNLRNLKYSHVKETYDADELKTYNKKSLTRVLPDKIVREKTNFNWATPWYLGCQFICMDYFSDDDYMKSYLKRFSKCSFILKPYKLRYHPTLIAPPKAQIPHVSFAPEQLTTPTYSITY